jgi:PAS domain S-box-containing protein
VRISLMTLVADRAVFVTDHDLNIVYTNAAFTGMFGHSPEEAQGR